MRKLEEIEEEICRVEKACAAVVRKRSWCLDRLDRLYEELDGVQRIESGTGREEVKA